MQQTSALQKITVYLLKGKNVLFKIKQWEADIQHNPDGINPLHIQEMKMEKLGATK